jgi:hypothetical protein
MFTTEIPNEQTAAVLGGTKFVLSADGSAKVTTQKFINDTAADGSTTQVPVGDPVEHELTADDINEVAALLETKLQSIVTQIAAGSYPVLNG